MSNFVIISLTLHTPEYIFILIEYGTYSIFVTRKCGVRKEARKLVRDRQKWKRFTAKNVCLYWQPCTVLSLIVSGMAPCQCEGNNMWVWTGKFYEFGCRECECGWFHWILCPSLCYLWSHTSIPWKVEIMCKS